MVALAVLFLAALALSGAAALLIVAHSPGPVVGCDLNTAHAGQLGRDSLVYAADGSALGTVPTGRNREPVGLWQMSRWLPEATVAIEDRRFWHHGALDYRAIARAALADLKAGGVVQGGSTITQQLVRDRYLGHRPMTLHRKLQEACLAVELARRWSKRRVLKEYLNLVFYGRHAYGAQAAAWTYFSRPASRLTLAQAALLAGLPQAPSLDDPFPRPRAALVRRNEVLAAMPSAGAISGCLNASGRWVVHNFADESTGTMTLQRAIAHSVNTIFAQVVMRVGPRQVVEVAHRMGIRSPLKPVCSITLGPEGVSPLEMTDAFATLAADGVHHDATALASRQRRAGRRVLARRVAQQVTQALTGVVRDGTGRAADPGRPAAGKTGTAEDFKDAWFCGYVPQLAACVWIGYPQAEIPMRNLDGFAQVVGGSVPARIWHDFMVGAMRGRPVRPLPAAT